LSNKQQKLERSEKETNISKTQILVYPINPILIRH